jgi:vanillate O-demethylase monooxygenase subunit
MHDIEPPPFWASNLKSREKCDRWQIGTFTLPANVMIDVGVARAGTGAPQGDRSQGVTGMVVDVMTPESETCTWYFWGMARDFEVKDQGLTHRVKEAQGGVFAEDIAVLEAQQENITRRPDRQMRNFNIDSGGVRARRLIERALAKQVERAVDG